MLRRALILSGLAEKALGLFLAAFGPFVAILATIEARLASVQAFTYILAMPVAQILKATPFLRMEEHSAPCPTNLNFPLFGQA